MQSGEWKVQSVRSGRSASFAPCTFRFALTRAKIDRVNTPVTPYVLAGRIFSIIGMGLTAACAILLFIIPEWTWAVIMTLAFFPFLGLIVLVERLSTKHGLIGPPDLAQDEGEEV